MEKIPTLFIRDPENMSRTTAVGNPACSWVLLGEGTATRKLNGMCCAMIDGLLFKRREVKRGRPSPDGFRHIATDEKTGKMVGWLRVGDGPEDRYFREALEKVGEEQMPEGTMELVGPKSQGGIEGWRTHTLIRHDNPCLHLAYPPQPLAQELEEWFRLHPRVEGIVWHHPDGRMAKIKGRDYGIKQTQSDLVWWLTDTS